MKIIDERPFNPQFVCEGCGSTLQAEADDVVEYISDGERKYYVTCPICGTKKILAYNELTPNVRTLASKKRKQ